MNDPQDTTEDHSERRAIHRRHCTQPPVPAHGTGIDYSHVTGANVTHLVSILTAKDGVVPLEILATTITDIKGLFFETIDFDPSAAGRPPSKQKMPAFDLEGLVAIR